MSIKNLAAAATLSTAALASHAAELKYSVYTADENSFHVTSTLVTGPNEAMIIGSAGFTRADALRIAAAVLDSGKALKTILISNDDPDYYFGAEVLHRIFPDADIVATPAVRAAIEAKLETKLKFWPPRMGTNAPVKPLLPRAIDATTLEVDGEAIEIRGTVGELANRPWVWIPSLRAIAGNVAVFADLHVWTADTQTPAKREAWLKQLDEMQSLRPAIVVAGHMKPGAALDASSIRFTSEYIKTFLQQASREGDSGALISEMRRRYPQAKLGVALEIGAKVIKGEMKW